MCIKLSERELEALLKASYLARWVLSSHKLPGKAQMPGEFRKMLQGILEVASRKDTLKDAVHYEKKTGNYRYSRSFEKKVVPIIEEYNSRVFWEELVVAVRL